MIRLFRRLVTTALSHRAAFCAAILAAAVPSLLAAQVAPSAPQKAEALYVKTMTTFTLQDPKARVITPAARKQYVLKQIDSADCRCTAEITLNEAPILRSDPDNAIVLTAFDGIALIRAAESRACEAHYFILSFRSPAWPEPIRTAQFGDCRPPSRITTNAAGTITIKFPTEVATFKDGKLTVSRSGSGE
jgi:hypothetical protein